MDQRFVKPFTGLDTNLGTFASPVKTTFRAQQLAAPGDEILIYSGETAFGSLQLTKSGLTFGTYNGSEKAKLSGFLEVTGWTYIGDGKWEAAHSSLLDTVAQLTIENIPREKGRYPKSTAPNGGWLPIGSAGPGTVTNSALSAYSLVGAEVVVRTLSYTAERAKITAQSGGTIVWTDPIYGNPTTGYGFHVQNHTNFLTSFGDWMYDSASKKITCYFGEDNPNELTIKASAIDRIIHQLYGNSDYVFQSLIIEGSNGHAVSPYGGSGFVIEDVDFRNIGVNAVYAQNHTGVEINDSTFKWVNNTAVELRAGTNNSRVENCEFEDIGLFTGHYKNGVGQGSAAITAGAGTELRFNTVNRVGYNGLAFEGSYSKIIKNVVENFCLRLSDGGGIYSRNASKSAFVGMEILNNIVRNSGDSSAGTPYSGQEEGIYMDDYTRGVLIQYNAVYNITGKAVFLHNNLDVIVLDNLLFNNRFGIYSQSDDNPRTRYIIIKRNKVVALLSSQWLLSLHTNVDDLAQFSASAADFSQNIYYHPNPTGNTVRTQSGGGMTTRTFASWQALYGFDGGSILNQEGLIDVLDYRLEINEGDTDQVVALDDGTYINLVGDEQGASLTLAPYSGELLIKTGDTPVEPTYDLTVRENPIGWGTAVDLTDEGPYPEGAEVELQATPNADTQFSRWSRDGQTLSTNPSYLYTTRGQEDLVLGEFLPKQYALTLDGQMKGSGTGAGNYPEGTQVELTATAFSGLQFDGWYRDNVLLSKNNPYLYTTRGQADTLVMKFVSVPQSLPEADVTEGMAPLTVKFSCDWFVTGTTYLWDFKDSNTSTLRSPEHTFAAGTYDVSLTVTVGELSASETIQIMAIQPANEPPTATIISPTNLSASFVAPADILITTAASDPEGQITKVEFYANNEKIGEKLAAPYSFTWENVPVGVYSLQVKVYDDVQHTDSLPVSVSVYDPLAGYILNGKHLREYGIIPAQAPDSNIALTGAWDMPARIGKTYHEWPDEHNIEPYLLPEEIFFAGRDLKFYGLLQADSDQEARDKLYELYSDIDKTTSVVPFSSEWGSWEVHVLDGVKAENLGNGWYVIELPMRQPLVVMDAAIPAPAGSGFGIDGFTWGELGLILMETQDPDNRPEVRQAETTFYGREEVGVKKRGLKEFKLRFVLREDTYEVFNSRIKVLQAIFSSAGARTFRLEDGSYREGFIKDGFTVSQVMVRDGEVSAVLEVTVAQIRQLNTWNLLTDSLGNVLTDGRGRPLTDLLKWI